MTGSGKFEIRNTVNECEVKRQRQSKTTLSVDLKVQPVVKCEVIMFHLVVLT